MKRAWNGWYHISFSTYGTWVRGDRRGWRARHHREHVEGDYRHPPPEGKYDELLNHSHELMGSPDVLLRPAERELAGKALVEKLLRQNVELLILSLDAVHCHALGRFGRLPIRIAIGHAKKHAYHVLCHIGRSERIWGLKCHMPPIQSRSHQLNVFRYIADHAQKGAWVWTFKEGIYWTK